jgi:hypothetical protein
MDKYRYKVIFSLALLTGLLFMPACDKNGNQVAGVLEGVISIGPICPVETIPPDPGCLPTAETYKAYPVSIWTANGSRKIALINPALDGSYKAELAPGNYLIKLENQQNRIGASNLPVEISIISQEKTLLNISIDTGIR